MALHVDELPDVIAADAAGTALFTDFDGTLSPIVARADEARPVPGAPDALGRLARRLLRVAVLSGRPLDYLAPLVPAAVDISALYGLEQRVAGRRGEHPDAGAWRAVVADAVADGIGALAALTAVVVEPKGLSVTVHYRNQPAAEGEVRAWAEGIARRTGLDLRGAKASVELHPPIEASKGSVLREWAAGAGTVVFFGDDVGDLPAFEALGVLRAEGRRTVAVAVGGDELPDAVAAAADVVLDGPPMLAGLLQAVADRLEAGPAATSDAAS